jgi:hypothetical protein
MLVSWWISDKCHVYMTYKVFNNSKVRFINKCDKAYSKSYSLKKCVFIIYIYYVFQITFLYQNTMVTYWTWIVYCVIVCQKQNYGFFLHEVHSLTFPCMMFLCWQFHCILHNGKTDSYVKWMYTDDRWGHWQGCIRKLILIFPSWLQYLKSFYSTNFLILVQINQSCNGFHI